MRALLKRIESWLASPRAPLAIVVIAILVVLPSLGNGLAADDHWHRISLTGDAAWSSLRTPWWRLFTFYDGDPVRTHLLTDLGLSPWWTDETLTIAFFRPVSAATQMVDYTLWPSHPWLMHAHSIAWYAALVAIATWVYRRVIGGWAAGLAGLVYALDANHGIPIGWLANRNAIVVGVFAVASLGAHDVATRGRRRGGVFVRERSLAWSIGSALLFALALGAGEGGLATGGFLVSHALYMDVRPWRSRLASLAPQLVAGALWALVYRAGGYGVRGSGMYVEPLREPLQFIAQLAKHLPMLVASELGSPPPDVYTFLPLPAKVAMVAVALLFLAWAAASVMRVLRIDPAARFLFVGALLGALPACATFPSGRLLIVPGFGLVGLTAIVGGGVASGAAWVPAAGAGRRLVRSFAIWSCAVRLLLSPLVMQVGLLQMVILNRIIGRMAADVPTQPVPGLRRVVFMNVPDVVFAPYAILGRGAQGDLAPEQMPSRLFTIASGARAIVLRRTDEHTVVVRIDGGFYRIGTELVTRNENVPMPAGTKVVLSDLTVEVLATSDDGVPTEVSFRFEEPADASVYLWQRWDGARIVKTHPPPVGEQIAIPAQVPALF